MHAIKPNIFHLYLDEPLSNTENMILCQQALQGTFIPKSLLNNTSAKPRYCKNVRVPYSHVILYYSNINVSFHAPQAVGSYSKELFDDSNSGWLLEASILDSSKFSVNRGDCICSVAQGHTSGESWISWIGQSAFTETPGVDCRL